MSVSVEGESKLGTSESRQVVYVCVSDAWTLFRCAASFRYLEHELVEQHFTLLAPLLGCEHLNLSRARLLVLCLCSVLLSFRAELGTNRNILKRKGSFETRPPKSGNYKF